MQVTFVTKTVNQWKIWQKHEVCFHAWIKAHSKKRKTP